MEEEEEEEEKSMSFGELKTIIVLFDRFLLLQA